ncbi:hypothetical protein [Arthrobacter sp. B0490]|uniref:hypothetical protein n=1 Tax=Arthrobacter sp. B0490 TaxID=2058891 RepID=UPI0011B049B7|nr:hypothetical protein [Arthrobacter sp. B0490]
MKEQKPDRRRSARDFWLCLLIPLVPFVGLLVFFFTSLPRTVFPHSLVVAAAGLLAGGVIGLFTGVRGPDWPIYGLIFAGLAVLLLLSPPWQGLALAIVPASACGYATGKEIAIFRIQRRPLVPPVKV